MNTLKNFAFKDKRVLLRANFDIPIDEKGEIIDDFRIRRSLPTIKFLIENDAKIILIGHLGRPDKIQNIKTRVQKLTLYPIAKKLSSLLDKEVKFVKTCVGREAERAVKNLKSGEILLLENLRFFPGEISNDNGFAKQLSSLGEIFVNDAFSNAHREHASVVGIPKYLPSVAGLLFEEEVKILSAVLEKPKRPLVAILGGAKLKTKIPCLINLLKIADHILVGGKIAPAILFIKGISLSPSILEDGEGEELSGLELTNSKLHMPIDAMVGLKNHQSDYLRQSAVGRIRKEEQMFDIGPESVRMFSDIIQEAKTVIWNGPLGYIEDERFAGGTLAIASAILRGRSFSVVGGGDTSAFLAENNLRGKFDYVSTGGGAMLEFFSGNKLPGIKVLER
ncbi:phosphoglycerate kinase [Patescibacteria group bacterium]|nr:phosphoglycerate kinase [Patescibacteria group bacterium]MBU4161988.1 phosphoglycerate kinase [Patescibacteria group bacterium]